MVGGVLGDGFHHLFLVGFQFFRLHTRHLAVLTEDARLIFRYLFFIVQNGLFALLAGTLGERCLLRHVGFVHIFEFGVGVVDVLLVLLCGSIHLFYRLIVCGHRFEDGLGIHYHVILCRCRACGCKYRQGCDYQ